MKLKNYSCVVKRREHLETEAVLFLSQYNIQAEDVSDEQAHKIAQILYPESEIVKVTIGELPKSMGQ